MCFTLGLDAGSQSITKQSTISSNVEVPIQSQCLIENQPQGQWGENRLADVVKGTAKTKLNNSKECSNDINESPRATSPQHFQLPTSNQTFRQISPPTGPPPLSAVVLQHNQTTETTKDVSTDSGSIQLSTVTLTPPTSPEKQQTVTTSLTATTASAMAVQLPTKCTMADKSTKTDDALLLNGELELTCPTTTNAATMTTIVPTEAPSRAVQIASSTSVKAHVSVHRQDSRTDSMSKQPQAPSPPPPTVSGQSVIPIWIHLLEMYVFLNNFNVCGFC